MRQLTDVKAEVGEREHSINAVLTEIRKNAHVELQAAVSLQKQLSSKLSGIRAAYDSKCAVARAYRDEMALLCPIRRQWWAH